jgi:hypothetical protein
VEECRPLVCGVMVSVQKANAGAAAFFAGAKYAVSVASPSKARTDEVCSPRHRMPCGLMDSACHVIGCHLNHETRLQDAFNDLASTIYQSLVQGRPLGGGGRIRVRNNGQGVGRGSQGRVGQSNMTHAHRLIHRIC